MEKSRYNRTFKKGIAAIIFCILLLGSTAVFSVASQIQYKNLVPDMKPVNATIIDIDWDIHYKGTDEQIIYISYEVEGKAYSRKLSTDTQFSFPPGIAANYSIGDTIEILYHPENPDVIASPRSLYVGIFVLVFALFFLGLVAFSFFFLIINSKKYLVTQEEYIKEGEELKKMKAKSKQNKRKKAALQKERHPIRMKIFKIILIIILSLIGAFILLLVLGAILKALGY